MHTPKSPDDFSPEGEFPEDEIQPIYNEATMNKPILDEDEWLAMHSILDIEPIFNPVTQSSAEQNEEP